MKISVFGTGVVGQTISSKLSELGHEVMMGSRSADNAKAIEWVKSTNGKAKSGSFAQAAEFGELIFNCTSGGASLDVMKLAGPDKLRGKIIIDVANPLDFSRGMPPTLIPSLCNTTSLAEEIQKYLPDSMVVKSLNTMNCYLMVSPDKIANEHDVFLCGNDESAKEKTVDILRSFGWKAPIDLGDLTASRGLEMILPLWLRIYGTYQSPYFNFKIIR